MFYRTDLIAAAGFVSPPATWDEWKDLARKLKRLADRDGREAFAILLPTNEWAPPTILALQLRAPILKERMTRGAFADSLFRTAFESYCSFFHEGLAPIGVTHVDQRIHVGVCIARMAEDHAAEPVPCKRGAHTPRRHSAAASPQVKALASAGPSVACCRQHAQGGPLRASETRRGGPNR